ncbi:MAG TPA: transposase [Phycisphaerales bacterium]|nr:transposase [Phycisphaerales bacterium]
MYKPKRRRYEDAHHARFLTFSCYQRLAFFSNPAIADVFVSKLDATRVDHGFRLFGWVVMPEHVHLLIWPRIPESPVRVVLQSLKQAVAQTVLGRWKELDAPVLTRVHDAYGLHFWQRGGGYDRNIVGGREFYEKLRYIHQNPVQRGLVVRAREYRWSSARWYAGEREGTIGIDEMQPPA